MIQYDPDQIIIIMIALIRTCYLVRSWIKPSLILPSDAINYTKKYILIISKVLVISSSLLLSLDLSIVTRHSSLRPTPVILVVDQSRSMSHNDLTPSRRSVATQITDSLPLWQVQQLITYAQVPALHSSLVTINSLSPIATQAWSSALGDAWLIAYDQIASWLDYRPIVITITDGGSNTGYDLSQTASILQTRAQLWIVWLSTGTQIVAYDDDGRWLTSSMDSALLSSLVDSWHRYPIPDDISIDWTITKLWQDLSSQYYRLQSSVFSLQSILWILLWFWVLWRGWIYLSKNRSNWH